MALGAGEFILVALVAVGTLAFVAVPIAIVLRLWSKNKTLGERLASLERRAAHDVERSAPSSGT